MTLDCNAMSPSQTITYEWMDLEGSIIPSRFLSVSMEGTYTCRASNLDFPNVNSTSVLVCKW